MGRTRGSKNSKVASQGKGKERIPASAEAKKTRSMDEILGVQILNVQSDAESEIEGELLSPKSSLIALKKQFEEKTLFSEWLNVINSGTKTPITVKKHNVTVGSMELNIDERVEIPWNGEIEGNCGNKEVMNTVHNKSTVKLPEIELDDIQEEIQFWQNSVVCYILGASPPQKVMEGFIRRIWGMKGMDMISLLGNGVYMVRFTNKEDQERVLAMECQFFDGKPVIVKPWKADIDWKEKRVDSVPIWVELKGLDLKYWGVKSMSKIVSRIGKFVRADKVTQEKSNLSFARVLVEVKIDQQFPEMIQFLNENGVVINQQVYYEWKPIKCTQCNGYGHNKDQCFKPVQQKKKWVEKNMNGKRVANQTEKELKVDNPDEIGARPQPPVQQVEVGIPSMNNSFAMLTEASTEELFYDVGHQEGIVKENEVQGLEAPGRNG